MKQKKNPRNWISETVRVAFHFAMVFVRPKSEIEKSKERIHINLNVMTNTKQNSYQITHLANNVGCWFYGHKLFDFLLLYTIVANFTALIHRMFSFYHFWRFIARCECIRMFVSVVVVFHDIAWIMPFLSHVIHICWSPLLFQISSICLSLY